MARNEKTNAADELASVLGTSTPDANQTATVETVAEATPKKKRAKKGEGKKKEPSGKPAGRAPLDAKVLRLPQIRIMAALTAANATNGQTALTMEQLVKATKVGAATLRQGMGPIDPDCRESHNGATGYRCLLSRGLVKIAHDEERGTTYYLSPTGEKKVADADPQEFDHKELRKMEANKNMYTSDSEAALKAREKRAAKGKKHKAKKATK